MSEELFEYGIHVERSDVRAHVSPLDKTIYVFQTFQGLRAIQENDPPLVPGYQLGVKGRTAEGWLTKIEWIKDIRRLRFHSWDGWNRFSSAALTSQKGELAVECVVALMRAGRFPLWLDCSEDDRVNVQLAGTDILIFARKKIQVKCDYPAGRTGNLFLQKAERNPLRRH